MDTGPGRLGLLLCRVNSDPPAQLDCCTGTASWPLPCKEWGAYGQLSPALQVAVAPNLRCAWRFTMQCWRMKASIPARPTNALGPGMASATFDTQRSEWGCECVSGWLF